MARLINQSALDRLLSFVCPEPMSGCWLWTGYLNSRGYGQLRSFEHDSRKQLAHRRSYELHIGPIPKDMTIDHKCRVRSCVNPAHLEAVTMRENLERGNTWKWRKMRREGSL